MTETMIQEQTESMTQEHFTRAARTGQEAISTAVRTWAETVQSALGMRAGPGDAPTPAHLIHVWFDIAAEMLDAQRQRVDLLLDVGGAAAAVARQFLARPPFGGVAQPRLGDPGEDSRPG